MSQTNKLCLVTGASSGIGLAISREYAARGWDVALAARREGKLRALADELTQTHNVTCFVLPVDLSDRAANAQLIKTIHDQGRQIDGLVNNAGLGLPGQFIENDWPTHEGNLDLMLNGPSQLTHMVLPHMIEQGFGQIMNVASLAGHLPGSKGHTQYSAMKTFLIKVSQSLNMELRGHGIKVSALCPGFTYSEFHDVNGTRNQMNRLPKFMFKSAEYVAKSGLNALERGKAVHIPGGVNKFIALLGKILPDSLALAIMRTQSEKFRKG